MIDLSTDQLIDSVTDWNFVFINKVFIFLLFFILIFVFTVSNITT